MSTGDMIMQILMGACGTLGFALLFNVRGWKLLFGFLGGAIGWSVYLLTGGTGTGDLKNYLYAAVATALYAEILARIFRAPVPVFLVPSVIPMIPGGSLYYTMAACIRGDLAESSERGGYTLAITAMLALGIVTVMVFMNLMKLLCDSIKKRNRAGKETADHAAEK